MKIKTSMKICKSFENVYSAGYCDLQYIFHWFDPKYYNCGVYGWNCDLYVDYNTDTIFTTGYRNMRGKWISHELIKKYSDIAKKIIENNDFSKDAYNRKMQELENNRNAFIKELLEK